MPSDSNLSDRSFLSLLAVLAFFIPLHLRITVLCIILLMIYGLYTHFRAGRFKPVLHPMVLLFGGFYVLHLVGLLYTTNLVEGAQDVETKLSLLLFPLFFFSFPPISNFARQRVFTAFVVGNLLSILICLSLAAVEYSSTGRNTFHYQYLSSHLNYHPAYLAIYQSFSLFLVLNYGLKNREKLSTLAQLALVALAGFFLIMVIILSSRMVIIATILTLGVTYLVWMYRRGKLAQGVGFGLLAIVLLGAIIWSFPKTRFRIQHMIESFTEKETEENKPNIRLQIWSAAYHLWSESPILGYGTGDIQDNLLETYQKEKIEEAAKSNFNTHNQYLQTTIGLGLIGGLWIIASLLLPFWWARQEDAWLYLIFLSLMIIAMLTESMLEKEQGVLFYAFFNSLLASSLVRKKAVL